jgi:hypothetical protein
MSKVRDTLKDILGDEGTYSPEALIRALVEEWGGIAGLAESVRTEFQELPEKHPGRIAILKLIVDGVLRFGEDTDEGETDPAVIEAQLRKLLQKNGDGDG